MGRLALDLDFYLDRYVAPRGQPSYRRKRRSHVNEKRPRWRMTLDELCYVAKVNVKTFDTWADAGLLGKRLASRPDKGRGRHITRETAQRTVLVARLVAAGVHPDVAGCVAAGHKTGDNTPLVAALPGGVQVTVSREDLP